jgi:hypothetical protein
VSEPTDAATEDGGTGGLPPRPAQGLPRGPLLMICLILVTVPTVVLLGVCAYKAFSLIVFGGNEHTSPMNLLAAIMFPVPLLLVLMFEYHAVIKRSAAAALLMGALFFFPLLPGLLSLKDGVGGLVGLSEPHPHYTSWVQAAGVVTCLTVTTFIAVVHLRWWRRLMRWHWEAEQSRAEEDGEEDGGAEQGGAEGASEEGRPVD